MKESGKKTNRLIMVVVAILRPLKINGAMETNGMLIA
jgi:hypothetical protein